MMAGIPDAPSRYGLRIDTQARLPRQCNQTPDQTDRCHNPPHHTDHNPSDISEVGTDNHYLYTSTVLYK